jgi:hypothetical protein
MLKASIWSVFAWRWLPIGWKDFHIVRQGEETNKMQQQPIGFYHWPVILLLCSLKFEKMKKIHKIKVQNFLPPPPLIDNDFTGNLLLSAAINQSHFIQ